MKPVIFTLTGPSCAGKSTLEKMMCDDLGFARVISDTTRQKRVGELDGLSYFFVSKSEFKRLLHQGAYMEHVEFANEHYGLPVKEVKRLAGLGKSIVVVAEPGGRDQIATFCDAHEWQHCSIFVDGNPEVIANRFLGRFAMEILNRIHDDDTAANDLAVLIKRYSERMALMASVEVKWTQAAFAYDSPYNYVIREFDQLTTPAHLLYVKMVNEKLRGWVH